MPQTSRKKNKIHQISLNRDVSYEQNNINKTTSSFTEATPNLIVSPVKKHSIHTYPTRLETGRKGGEDRV